MSAAPRGAARQAHHAAPGSRGPRGHAEVRLRRRARRARARERARDRGARGRGRARQGAARDASASTILSHVVRIGGGRGARRDARPGPEDLDAVDDERGALLRRRERRRRWSPRSRPRPRRATRSAASSRCIAYGVPVGTRQLRALGPQARRAARGGAHEHSGGQGRRDRRRHGPGRPARQRGARRHRASTTSFARGGGYVRRSDHAGGLEGGMTSGAPLDRQGRDEAAGDAEPTGPRDGRRRDGRVRRCRSRSAPT